MGGEEWVSMGYLFCTLPFDYNTTWPYFLMSGRYSICIELFGVGVALGA